MLYQAELLPFVISGADGIVPVTAYPLQDNRGADRDFTLIATNQFPGRLGSFRVYLRLIL